MQILLGFPDDLGIVVVLNLLVASDDEGGLERRDFVQVGNPLCSFGLPGFGRHHVHLVVGHVPGDDSGQGGNVEHGAFCRVSLADLDDAQFIVVEPTHQVCPSLHENAAPFEAGVELVAESLHIVVSAAIEEVRYCHPMLNPDDVNDVLAVIGLYEDGTEDCNNAVLDVETGLNPTTVDEALEHLWKSDQIEGILTLGGRITSLDSIRRVLPDRDWLWGDDGRYRPHS